MADKWLVFIAFACSVGAQIPSAIFDPSKLNQLEDFRKSSSNMNNNVATCHLVDGSAGVCVKSVLCQDNRVDTQGTDQIPYRSNSMSTCYDGEVCCLLPEDQQNPSKTSKGCGVRNDNVLFRDSGVLRNAESGEFPWTVAIFRYNQGWKYLCVGSLIHPRAVLSVAHYFTRDGKWRVHAGDHNLSNRREPVPHQEIDVASVVTHEDYDSGEISYDVALLFLEMGVQDKPNVGYVCLPKAGLRTPVDTACLVSGWGKIGDNLQMKPKMMIMPIVDRVQCLTSVRSSLKNPEYEIPQSMLCAGGEVSRILCQGSGGAPLVCSYPGNTERYYQAGITSWGASCEEPVPSMYTDVAYVRRWIDSNMQKKGYGVDTYTMQ